MKISYDFIKQLKETNCMKIIQIIKNHNIYEFSIDTLPEGRVIGTILLEDEVIDELGNLIGYFGIDFHYNILVYNLFRKEEKL